MTAIAWDGRYLAADSGCYYGDMVSQHADKIRVSYSRCKIASAFAGPRVLHKFVHAYAAAYLSMEDDQINETRAELLRAMRETVELLGGDSAKFTAIIVLKAPSVRGVQSYLLCSGTLMEPIGAPICMGIAREFCQGAVIAGATAQCAVSLACDNMVHVHAPVKFIDTASDAAWGLQRYAVRTAD